MAWPETRLTTYAPGAKVKSADLNAIQDATIGGKHGVVWRAVGVGGMAVYSGAANFNTQGYATGTFSGNIFLQTLEGEIITAVKVHLKDIVGATVQWLLERLRASTGVASAKSDVMTSDNSGAVQEMSATTVVLEARAAGDIYKVNVVTADVGHHIRLVEYAVKLP